jgi:uncharacterized protein YheU (UPF0270 family)
MDSSADAPAAAAVPIPHEELSAEALRGVIESFVLREGTDYGQHEATFESKIDDVMRQLMRGEAEILWDPTTETVHLVPGRRRRGSLV